MRTKVLLVVAGLAVGAGVAVTAGSLLPGGGARPRAARPAPVDRAARHQQTVAAISAEARAPAWAEATETELRGALTQAAADGGYEVLGVDCHTTGCLARLRWPSEVEARLQFGAILRLEALRPCGRAVFLAPKGDASGYEATATFECPGA